MEVLDSLKISFKLRYLMMAVPKFGYNIVPVVSETNDFVKSTYNDEGGRQVLAIAHTNLLC